MVSNNLLDFSLIYGDEIKYLSNSKINADVQLIREESPIFNLKRMGDLFSKM